MHSCRLLCLLALSLSVTQARAAEPDMALELGYESVAVPGHPDMGLMSVSLWRDLSPNFSLGILSHAAVEGDLGGFITLGAGGRLRYPLGKKFNAVAGLDLEAGGGRGGYTLSGGGLMVRSHLGLETRLGRLGNLELGISHVTFPDGGNIESSQPYLAWRYDFDGLARRGWGDDDPRPDRDSLRLPGGRHDFALLYRHNKVTSSGLSDFGVLGAQWRSYLGEYTFLNFDSQGALSGNSTGYMQILLGAGVMVPLGSRLSVGAQIGVGAGGGGGVETGGGSLVKADAELSLKLSPRWHVDLSAGQIRATSGGYKSNELGVALGYQFGPEKAKVTEGEVRVHHLRLRLAEQLYVKAADTWRTHHADENVGNLGAQLDYFFTPHWYVTGQGFAAHSGNAGAYMTGLVGSGLRWPLAGRWSMEWELLGGAAGGGGLAMGSGALLQTNLGLVYQLNSRLACQLSVGEARALDGDFRAHVLGLSLALHERLYERR
jgi:hypothetical protein